MAASIGSKPVRLLLLGQCFRALLGRGREVDSGQESADKHHQQIDFHVFLRCLIAA
jgi:hypothetical protein